MLDQNIHESLSVFYQVLNQRLDDSIAGAKSISRQIAELIVIYNVNNLPIENFELELIQLKAEYKLKASKQDENFHRNKAKVEVLEQVFRHLPFDLASLDVITTGCVLALQEMKRGTASALEFVKQIAETKKEVFYFNHAIESRLDQISFGEYELPDNDPFYCDGYKMALEGVISFLFRN